MPLRKDEFKSLDIKPKITVTSPTTNIDIGRKNDIDNTNSSINEAEIDPEQEVVEKEDSPPLLGPNVCIFDDKKFETTEECLQYMSIKFGFFIPDVEYLADLDGFLSYLGEKV